MRSCLVCRHREHSYNDVISVEQRIRRRRRRRLVTCVVFLRERNR